MASVDRILTTHVGSLVRPDDFTAVLRRKVAGELSEGEFDAPLRDAVAWVVRKQAEAGIDIMSDGEYGKIGGWEQYVLDRLSGFGAPPSEPITDEVATGDMARFADFYREFWPMQEHPEAIYPCISEIAYTGFDELNRDIGNLQSAMQAVGVENGFW